MIQIGDRLGLYKAMSGAGPVTPAELADAHLTPNEALCCTPSPTGMNFYREAYGAYTEAVGAVSSLYR